jgi:RHS repeat-associated protein
MQLVNAIVDSGFRSLFSGKERDTESGNDYMFARYYNSATGRFLSPDWSAKVAPVPYAKLDNPQSLNLYSYVLNNPVVAEDPDGHATWYDPKGKLIGSDGVNDGGVVIANRDGVARGNDGQIDSANSTSMYTVTHDESLAVHDSVARSDAPSVTDPQGGMHEEGFVVNGPGNKADIQNLPSSATIGPNGEEPRIQVTIGPNTTMVEHVHAAGPKDAATNPFAPHPDQDPSDTIDVPTAKKNPKVTFVEVGAGNGKVNFYGPKGKATVDLKNLPSQ